MPNGPFAHVCLVVENLDRALEDWTKILRALDPGQLEQPVVVYDDFSGGSDTGMRWATFVSDHGAEIQLIQPGPGTPLGRRLEQVGEHVHHICFTTDDPGAVARRLAEEGIATSSDGELSDPSMPWQRWTWLLPSTTHGTLVEVARPYRAVDGRWVSASDDDGGK